MPRQALSPAARIAKAYPDAVQERCEEHGCSLGLEGLPERVVLKGELVPHQGRICDGLVFVAVEERGVALAAVELKSGSYYPEEVLEQLQNGATAGSGIASEQQVTISRFLAVLLHRRGSRGSTAEFRHLRRAEIEFGGRKQRVTIEQCGACLSELVFLAR